MANQIQPDGAIEQIYFRHTDHGQPHFHTHRHESAFASVHLQHERGQAYEPHWETLDLQHFATTRRNRPTRAEVDALAAKLVVELGALQTSNPQSPVKPFRANALVFFNKWCIVLGEYHLYGRTGDGTILYLSPPVGSLMTEEQREAFKVPPSIERLCYDTRVDSRGTLIFHTPAECVYDCDSTDEVIATTVRLHETREWESMSRLSMESPELAGFILMTLRRDGLENATDHALFRWRNLARRTNIEAKQLTAKRRLFQRVKVGVRMDHFKRFNDVEGCPAGDAILGHVEATARTFLRVRDTFARIGGEEFGMVLLAMDLQAGLSRGDTTSQG